MRSIRTAFSDHMRVATDNTEPSVAKQSMKAEVDINNILAKYQRTGAIDHLARYEGQYGFVESSTFLECMQVVAKAEQMFADLPSSVRKRFNNEPAAFLDFVQDPANIDEARKLGLAKPSTGVEPPVSAPAPSSAPADAPTSGAPAPATHVPT